MSFAGLEIFFVSIGSVVLVWILRLLIEALLFLVIVLLFNVVALSLDWNWDWDSRLGLVVSIMQPSTNEKDAIQSPMIGAFSVNPYTSPSSYSKSFLGGFEFFWLCLKQHV